MKTYTAAGAQAMCEAQRKHEFHYFGDQVKERRCLHCNRLESQCEAIEQAEGQEPVDGVVMREGLPTLVRKSDVKPTDGRLYTHPAPAQPAPQDEWLQDGGLLYRLNEHENNRDEINVTMADSSRSPEARTRRAGELLNRIRATAPAQQVQRQNDDLKKAIDAAMSSIAFYKHRCDLLQRWQSKMRDPERTIVCDILANGQTLEPAGDRYKQPPVQTASPALKPLTDEDISDIWDDWLIHIKDRFSAIQFARAIEAAHGIKEQE